MLNYFGQGALLPRDPTAAVNPFYHLAPSWGLYPLIALATAATIIASQAVISGAFSLHRLACQGERARDDRLGRDDRGRGRERDQRVQPPARREVVKGIDRRGRVPGQQGSLPEIVEHQSGEREAEPR